MTVIYLDNSLVEAKFFADVVYDFKVREEIKLEICQKVEELEARLKKKPTPSLLLIGINRDEKKHPVSGSQFGLLEKVLSLYPEIPVAVRSSLPEMKQKSKALGAIGFVGKSFDESQDAKQLFRILEKILKSKSKAQSK